MKACYLLIIFVVYGPSKISKMDTMDALDAMGVFDELQEVDVAASRRTRDTFPPELVNFTFEDRAHLICGIEMDPSGKITDNYLEVA